MLFRSLYDGEARFIGVGECDAGQRLVARRLLSTAPEAGVSRNPMALLEESATSRLK